jgi:hypothetical protein
MDRNHYFTKDQGLLCKFQGLGCKQIDLPVKVLIVGRTASLLIETWESFVKQARRRGMN